MTITKRLTFISMLLLVSATIASACGDHYTSVKTTCCGGRTLYQRVCSGIGNTCQGFGSEYSCSPDCTLILAGVCAPAPPKAAGASSTASLLDASERKLLASRDT